MLITPRDSLILMKSSIFLATVTLAIVVMFAPTSLAQIHAPNLRQPIRPEFSARAIDITTAPGAGFFNAHPWEIKIFKDGDSYIYSGKNIDTKTGISLANGRLTKSQGKHFYKWRNSGTIYQVTWRATDPLYARLQVFDRQGKEILNKLMWTPTGD
jgi:hypothetical protein